MGGLRILVALALEITILSICSVSAKPVFNTSEIEGSGAEVIFCDLDGRHSKDIVLVDGLNLCIFFQEAKGFSRGPQQRHQLDKRPSLLWPARLGKMGDSLLLMTSDGVTELYFTNRTSPPAQRQILKQKTIVPESLEKPEAKCFPLSANTTGGSSLIIVPVADGLQIWRHDESWHQAQFLERAVEAHLYPSIRDPGYNRTFDLQMSIGDLNGDGREDLIVMRNERGGMEHYSIYLQQTNGLFGVEPAFIYTNKADWRTALSWIDINRDGKVDLIRNTFLDEAFFVPGMRSGKVLVGVHLAGEEGRIPPEPQHVFRKHDWSSALPLVDVDGDGFLDMVVGYIPINPREARKAITAQQIDFNLKFYFFRAGTGFQKEPDCEHDVLLHFNNELLFTTERRLYYEQFINLNGDFNGDGKKDLLAKDHKDEISVYFFMSREKGFSREADLRFKCPEPIDWWEVRDINGDGISDLVLKLQGQKIIRLFTSQRHEAGVRSGR